MELSLGLLADSATPGEQGKLNVVGEFRYIGAHTLPAKHPRMAVVLRILANRAEVKDRQNYLEFEIVDQDGFLFGLPRSPKLPLRFGDVGPLEFGKQEARIIAGLNNVVFRKFGDHSIQFYVNSLWVGAIKFHVLKVEVPTPGVE